MTHADPSDRSTAEDREHIRELLAEYCFLLDDYRLREFAALFTAEGEWLSRNGNAKGRPGIEALLRELVPAPAVGNRRKHITANIVIRLAGDMAEVISNFLVIRESPTGPAIAVAGRYEDCVSFSEGRWRFRSRRLHHDIAGESGLLK
jgi:3-phenylpropionate/cinnamic acid dioxygenase small subunit